MAKRYRSLRREQRLLGGKIMFVDHFFPEVNKPPCGDQKLCSFIETRPGFGTQFWVHRADAEDVMVEPDAVPDGMTVDDMEGTARALQRLGLNINPSLLKKEPPPEEELTDEPLQLPSLTKVHKASKTELLSMVERFGWKDINTNTNAPALKHSVVEKVRSLMN